MVFYRLFNIFVRENNNASFYIVLICFMLKVIIQTEVIFIQDTMSHNIASNSKQKVEGTHILGPFVLHHFRLLLETCISVQSTVLSPRQFYFSSSISDSISTLDSIRRWPKYLGSFYPHGNSR